MPTFLAQLLNYLHTPLGCSTGISLIYSTSLAICRNPRIHQHSAFAGRAVRGIILVGWFYGFKMHLVVNDQGELFAFCLTPSNSMIGIPCANWQKDSSESYLGAMLSLSATGPAPAGPPRALPHLQTVQKDADPSTRLVRTEVVCKNCGAHSRHVFDEGPRETTGQRYCINWVSLNFRPAEEEGTEDTSSRS